MSPQPELKFYYAPGSCALSVHILLALSPLKFTAIRNQSDANGTVFVPGYERINPKLRVPALSIDGEVITEVIAVVTAIDQLYPEGNFFGNSAIERVRVVEWFGYVGTVLHAAGFAALFRPDRFTASEKESFEDVRVKAREKILQAFEFIEGKLSEGKEGGGGFAVGDGFTAVDAYLLVFYRWGNLQGFEMEKNFVRYTRLVRGVVEKEEVRGVLEVEGIESTLKE